MGSRDDPKETGINEMETVETEETEEPSRKSMHPARGQLEEWRGGGTPHPAAHDYHINTSEGGECVGP